MGTFFNRIFNRTLDGINHTESGSKKIAKKLDNDITLKMKSPHSTKLSYSLTKPEWQTVTEIAEGIESGDHDSSEKTYSRDMPSTAISKIKYDPTTELLSVKFVGGNIMYNYFRVPIEKVKEMMAASSVGNYFMKNIHDQYTANPGHHPENNKRRNSSKALSYATMVKDYKRVMKKGTLIGKRTKSKK